MKRYLSYFGYVVSHKWWVLVAGLKIGAPLPRLLSHDLSKFRPGEFVTYAKHFFAADGTRWPIAESGAFNATWATHIHRNDHHWQHWVLVEGNARARALPMPVSATLEMVADWMGAGRAIRGRWECEAWYAKNRNEMVLHPDTRAMVDRILGYRQTECGNACQGLCQGRDCCHGH